MHVELCPVYCPLYEAACLFSPAQEEGCVVGVSSQCHLSSAQREVFSCVVAVASLLSHAPHTHQAPSSALNPLLLAAGVLYLEYGPLVFLVDN